MFERKQLPLFRKWIFDRQIYRSVISLVRNRKDVRHIGLFWSNKYEVNTHRLISYLIKKKYDISLPSIIADYQMVFRKVKSSNFCKEIVHNCVQPTQQYPIVLPQSIDMFFIPLVAYDQFKNRLGYGQGYYDRYLLGTEKNKIIGLAYSLQCCEKVPVEVHDVKMSNIITEKGIS